MRLWTKLIDMQLRSDSRPSEAPHRRPMQRKSEADVDQMRTWIIGTSATSGSTLCQSQCLLYHSIVPTFFPVAHGYSFPSYPSRPWCVCKTGHSYRRLELRRTQAKRVEKAGCTLHMHLRTLYTMSGNKA